MRDARRGANRAGCDQIREGEPNRNCTAFGVRARESAEGRRIEPADFARQYLAAREVVNRLKREFGKAIQVDLLMKNNDGSRQFYRAGVDQIDNHIPEKYSPADVRHLLGLPPV